MNTECAAFLPQVAQDLLWTELSRDVESCCWSQQLPAFLRIQLVTLEAIGVNLRQEVGADVARDEARVCDNFPKKWNVVGHPWSDLREAKCLEEFSLLSKNT